MALSPTDDVEEALVDALRQVEGAYSLVVLTPEAVFAVATRTVPDLRSGGSATATWWPARRVRSTW